MVPLDKDVAATFDHIKNIYSSQGKRCLLLARKIVPGNMIKDDADTTKYEEAMTEQAKSDLILVGMVAIVDPLRPEIRDVMSTLRGAGIRIAMVRSEPISIFIRSCS